jgi:superfamily II DNA/RNA helicase
VPTLPPGFADQLETLRASLPPNERDDGDAGAGGAPAGGEGMGKRLGRQTLLFSATFPKTVGLYCTS